MVSGSDDPNPLVGSKSVKILRDAGIEVVTGFMKEECDRLNPVFFHYIKTGLPYVVMKYAATLDGKIATSTGESRWVTGEEARKRVHMSRKKYTAIMVGSNTVIKDDPMLTCRIENGRNPIRIVCDTKLRTPVSSKLVATASDIPLIIATGVNEEKRLIPYLENGVQIMHPRLNPDGHIDLNDLMSRLGKTGIDSILLEGGGTLNWSALKSGIVNRVEAYIAPKLFGGKKAPSPVSGDGFRSPSDAVMLENIEMEKIGEDILIGGDVRKCSQE